LKGKELNISFIFAGVDWSVEDNDDDVDYNKLVFADTLKTEGFLLLTSSYQLLHEINCNCRSEKLENIPKEESENKQISDSLPSEK
jgi:hypothetical protein